MKKIELSKQAITRLEEITDYYMLHESLERTLKVGEVSKKPRPNALCTLHAGQTKLNIATIMSSCHQVITLVSTIRPKICYN